MTPDGLVEVDSIEIRVLVDNEIDPISPSGNPAVHQPAYMQGISLTPLPSHDRGNASAEIRMGNICCGAHGLALLIVRTISPSSDAKFGLVLLSA